MVQSQPPRTSILYLKLRIVFMYDNNLSLIRAVKVHTALKGKGLYDIKLIAVSINSNGGI